VLQRPERVVLLSAPQAFFGLALNGLVLSAIVVVVTATAWLTAVQRVLTVRQAMSPSAPRRLTIQQWQRPALRRPPARTLAKGD